jgi:hypothetical protein
MASVAEVQDGPLREALAAAESALDAGDYLGSVQRSVEAYSRLIAQRPDMIIPPPTHRAAPPQVSRGAPLGGGGLFIGGPRPWPSDHGVQFVQSADQPPALSFTKQRFTLSEAATYFEYTLDLALRAQRHPSPS